MADDVPFYAPQSQPPTRMPSTFGMQMCGSLRHRIGYGLFVIAFAVISFGCAESNHRLADDSRLPKWFAADATKERSAYVVYIDVYGSGNAKVTLRQPDGTVISTKNATLEPYAGAVASDNRYPIRQIMRVDGVSEVFEQRERGPLLYVIDDPALQRGGASKRD